MNIYQSILKVQMNELGKSLRIFWSIWLLILIASYTLATLWNIDQFYFVSYIPALVWVAIYSFKAVNSDLHYVLQLGASRKQLIFAAAVLVAGLSFLMTGLHFLFTVFFSTLAENIAAIQPISLISWAASDSLNIFHSLVLDLISSIFIGCLMVFFASLHVRFGKLPLYLAGAAVLVSLPVPYIHEHLFEWIMHVRSGEILLSLLVFLLAGMACIYLSKQLLRKASLR
ncbi:hypothetical protein [Alkalicoccus daliensis]|uniref:ABC-2 family transporter protein n=1 Tax=Alkalicoccus daliensis TaxID=745820 RepID=A0A1G9ZDC4_9BACI|nr:hypothetical protein [Alkalicoccus daliensis]SDN19244.1 hypothetical protein SAMN04488053_10154 [Alkalicoccus daliensis]